MAVWCRCRTASTRSASPTSWAGARWSAALPVPSGSTPIKRVTSCAPASQGARPTPCSVSVRCTGMNSRAMTEWDTSRRLSIRLAGEAIKVGQALGYEIEPIQRMPAETWVAASEGDPAALEEVEGVMLAGLKRMTEEGRPSTGQDMLKGRRTEIEFLNGMVAAKGAEVGIPAPTHAALTEVVKRVERGEIEAHPRNVEKL